jgi:hypothetical protein
MVHVIFFNKNLHNVSFMMLKDEVQEEIYRKQIAALRNIKQGREISCLKQNPPVARLVY